MLYISIHALREEGDGDGRLYHGRSEISIHALREEGDFTGLGKIIGEKIFLSTPSARRATLLINPRHDLIIISIHALREEGDIGLPPASQLVAISIHALREEGD